MHVAFFNRSFHPDQTATGQLLTDLCTDLHRDHGWRVSVVTGPPLSGEIPTSRRRRVVQREMFNGVEIHRTFGTRFDKRRFAGRATNYVSYFASACWAGLRLERPDVVVALTDPPIIGLAGWMTARRARAPLVMSFRDLFPEVAALLEDFHSDAVNASLQRVNRFLCRRAARVVALGESMRRRLIEDKGAPPARTVIIPDWADTSAIVPGPKRNAFAAAHGMADRFVVMHSGNLGLSQGLDTLIEAAARLQDLTDVVVVLVGDGVKKAGLEAQVQARGLTNVRFLPFTPQPQLGDAFATADVFIVSLQPGLTGYIVPSKLYGILAAGRAYVAAVDPDGEVAAVTRRHDCGVVVPPGDAAAMAAAIRGWHADRRRLAGAGERARLASAAFDRRTQVANYDALLRAVVASPTTVDERPAVAETGRA